MPKSLTNSRRKFLSCLGISSFGLCVGSSGLGTVACQSPSSSKHKKRGTYPVVIATWSSGLPANKVAAPILEEGGRALDAVEAGVKTAEANPKNTTVGYGATPDRDGHITLDACIMDEDGNCGSVACIENIKHPISVARKVMEKTPHVMLVGQGAKQFALESGFPEEDLLTPEAKQRWEEWKKTSKYEPVINIENHDTIGMIALDKSGNLSGACTTSGLAYKMRGRVGDSPIIGAGLYVDNEVGGAVATGVGELVMKTLGTFLIVELMRQGLTPKEACQKGIQRIVEKLPDYKKSQIGYLAIDKYGEVGSYSIHKGFNYALYRNGQNDLVSSGHFINPS